MCYCCLHNWTSNIKKMFNNFRDSKNLLIGCLAVCFGVFVLIFSTYTVVEHGLKAGDISRSRNRQRVSPVQRLTSEKVMRCMKMLPDFQEKWRATYEWTKIMHTYQDIMLNPKLTWGERISGGSLVVHFLRYWRSAVSKIPGQTLQHHFVTSETHMDIEISVGCLVNLIGCWKDFDLADHPPFIPNLVRSFHTLFAVTAGSHNACDKGSVVLCYTMLPGKRSMRVLVWQAFWLGRS